MSKERLLVATQSCGKLWKTRLIFVWCPIFWECEWASTKLCVALGYRLPGTKTIPELIAEDKTSYYHALELADAGFKKTGAPDLDAMETLIEGLLAKQLLQVYQRATGNP